MPDNGGRGIIAAAFQTQYRQRLGHWSFNPAILGPERCKTTGCEVTPDKDANNPGAIMTRPVILLTRPEASSHRMAKLLSVAFGDRLDVCISPLMEIVLDPRLPSLDGIRTLIFTSANGVATYVAANGPKSLPCYTVGDATARAAMAAGLQATSAGGDADALVARIKQDKPAAPMLHVRGAHARGDIPERLGAVGVPVAQAIVYHQNALTLTEEAKALLDGDRPVILPLFSPRSAALMGSAPVSAKVYAVAISEATANALRFDVEQMHVASHPDFESMAKVVADLLDTTPWDKQMPL
ncbi:uroporphyrinogen-III synthase [Seohaeicola sp.]|uniref:uroporphyrinogen-III synthase n=1 Tax=Seohaeicola sp. TaxID=2042026 RepID=UPI003A86227F